MKLRIEKVGGEYFLDAVENNSIKNIAVFKNYDDALRARDALGAENARLRAEVERLQEAVRPRREDECLTLDHWRIRAYHLEKNWSRCSRACAIEQDKREQAEARAKQLSEALRKLEERVQRDEALLRQALERLEAAVEHFDPYMGDNECRPMENARYTITALRDRLGKGMDVF